MNLMNLFNSILENTETPAADIIVYNVTPVDALLMAVIGILLVFGVLALLMAMIKLTGVASDGATAFSKNHPEVREKIDNFKSKTKNSFKSVFKFNKNAELVSDVVQAVEQPLAEGSCGDLLLVKTSERDAVMIMAIVADATNTPLNQLRFKTIRNISQGEEK